ncbi:hypothetical protein [Streptomyces zagrosensis]|uniref:Uncharacterized protein n=1 Tax=Streptomyces zagrosensis TaxID=1042984 RepID=A0A7W9UY13_9ACTN|nr:hypothetical protein [Streptomyces zagrosensis]MBB5934319.1 hypothetical protein [Streptomyces zagrosensis]
MIPLPRLAARQYRLRQVVAARQAREGDEIALGELTRTIHGVQSTATGATLVPRDGTVSLALGVHITVGRYGT